MALIQKGNLESILAMIVFQGVGGILMCDHMVLFFLCCTRSLLVVQSTMIGLKEN